MVDCVLRLMRLVGFRSMYQQDVPFDNPTFVVGQNGSGKSNFADAFAFLSEAMKSPLEAVIERRGGFSAVSHRSSVRGRPANLTLAVRLERPDSDTTRALYGIDLHPGSGDDFEVATVEESGVTQAVRLALVQPSCGAVLIVMDADSDCPAELGPTVQAWAAAAADGTPCQVVLAHREYEAWFLAAIESLRGRRGVLIDAEPYPDPERHRGAKEQLESRMQPGGSYTWKPRTSRRSAACLLWKRPTAARDRFGSSPIHSLTWCVPWGTTSGCGRRPPGCILVSAGQPVRMRGRIPIESGSTCGIWPF